MPDAAAMPPGFQGAGFELDATEDGWLVARFPAPHRVCSWAVVNGGFTNASAVAWMQVREAELLPPVDPALMLREALEQRGLAGAVGLMTGVDVSSFCDRTVTRGDVVARCLATVGLGNALRVGDPTQPAPGPLPHHVGTINALCWVNAPLDECGVLEAASIAAAARTVAVVEAGVVSCVSRAPATGTGTDCLVIACPKGPRPRGYAGKHTAIGSALGAAVVAAVSAGVEGCLRDAGGVDSI